MGRHCTRRTLTEFITPLILLDRWLPSDSIECCHYPIEVSPGIALTSLELQVSGHGVPIHKRHLAPDIFDNDMFL